MSHFSGGSNGIKSGNMSFPEVGKDLSLYIHIYIAVSWFRQIHLWRWHKNPIHFKLENITVSFSLVKGIWQVIHRVIVRTAHTDTKQFCKVSHIHPLLSDISASFCFLLFSSLVDLSSACALWSQLAKKY